MQKYNGRRSLLCSGRLGVLGAAVVLKSARPLQKCIQILIPDLVRDEAAACSPDYLCGVSEGFRRQAMRGAVLFGGFVIQQPYGPDERRAAGRFDPYMLCLIQEP